MPESTERKERDAPSCENYKQCGLYAKILPVLDEHVDNPEQRDILDQLFDICKTGTADGEKCTAYEVPVCNKYPGCTTIKGRLNPMFKNALMDTSIRVCFLRDGRCMDNLDKVVEKITERYLK